MTARSVGMTMILIGAVLMAAAIGLAGQQTTLATGADGVFTAAQAERGRQKFEQNCAFCHALAPLAPDARVEGWSGPALVGDAFIKRFVAACAGHAQNSVAGHERNLRQSSDPLRDDRGSQA